MTKQHVQATVTINNTPDAVLGYIADVRHRPLFLPSLKSITNVKGSPAGADTTWTWTWVLLGVEFSGTGRSLEYQPGKLYAFKTEGSIESTWTYRATAKDGGTDLTVDVEYQPPASVLGRLRGGSQAAHQAEADFVLQNLKTILDQ